MRKGETDLPEKKKKLVVIHLRLERKKTAIGERKRRTENRSGNGEKTRKLKTVASRYSGNQRNRVQNRKKTENSSVEVEG